MKTTRRIAAVTLVHPVCGGVVAAKPHRACSRPRTLRANNAGGRAEINFPRLCKDWRLRIVDCAGIKVGSAPQRPRVARELHAGNHREKRFPHVTACSWYRFAFFLCCLSSLFRLNALLYPLSSGRFLRVPQSYKRAIHHQAGSMRTLLLAALFGLVHCQFQEPEKIVSYSRDLGDTRGHYSFAYETEGGILQQETGSRKYAGTDDETQLIQGSVQYNAPDGTPIAISWTADEFGTQVSGTHVPTPPPIPPAIQRALEWIAKQPTTPEPVEKINPTQNAVPRDNRQYRLSLNKQN